VQQHDRRHARAGRARRYYGRRTRTGTPEPQLADLEPTMEWLPELSEFLRIKSISADPAHGDDVKRAGEWVCARVREAGGECDLVDWHGQPLAIGEISASDDGDAPT